jgi:hypothetical protein
MTKRIEVAGAVAELLTERYYENTVRPHLLKYKDTVTCVLLEEETLDSLEVLEECLLLDSVETKATVH